jgi:crossover junction endodeoxyribonuclease RuvC
MRYLGIDPGLRITGYGCVDAARAEPRLVEAGVFRLVSRESETVSDRLLELDRDLAALIERLRPKAVAVEALFAHYKHPATAISMGHARGVILLAVRRASLPLVELKPNAVKKFMTGNGHASKEQMQDAVQERLRLREAPDPPDVADAIAIAMCAASRAVLAVDGSGGG